MMLMKIAVQQTGNALKTRIDNFIKKLWNVFIDKISFQLFYYFDFFLFAINLLNLYEMHVYKNIKHILIIYIFIGYGFGNVAEFIDFFVS